MIFKLLTEHHLEFLSLKGGWRGWSESTRVKNATVFEITCHGSLFYAEIFCISKPVTKSHVLTPSIFSTFRKE